MSAQPPVGGETGEAFFAALFARAAAAMIAVDTEFRVICWNQAAAEMLEVLPADAMGRDLADVLPLARREDLRRALVQARQRGMTSTLELRLTEENPEGLTVRVLVWPVPSAAGQACGVAVMLLEEATPQQLSERLMQAEKMASLGTLAGGVAHHFNNIIAGVATFVDFALSSGDTASMRRALEMTANAASRISEITQSLLSFAVHGRHGADMADLTEVILTFVHLSERTVAERNIQLKLDLEPVPIIAVERARMHQVLANLLANAEEAMPDGGTVSVALTSTPTRVVLRFADTGEGMSPDKTAKIFEPFYTTKGLLAGGEKSNPGLGLSVVHGIIQEMGGSIEVESAKGAGTSFTIGFPIPATAVDKATGP